MKITSEESVVSSSRLASMHVRNFWLELSQNGSVQRHGLNAFNCASNALLKMISQSPLIPSRSSFTSFNIVFVHFDLHFSSTYSLVVKKLTHSKYIRNLLQEF